jgi:hypothetical protein
MIAVILFPIARAFAKRIGGGNVNESELVREIQGLRDDIEALRADVADSHRRLAELDDVQNRLDFAERVIAQGKDRGALPGSR